ncbi:DUF5995 family protein [Sorangium cellulosum]|uniref:DUF5995 family protein n=1 Tax=Sorangium cellulosum TaxID=56 RepID=UPI003D9A1C1D
MTATTIQQAIDRLHAITARAERDATPMGYFSALYARVTTTVARRLREGFFDDGPRMERIDVAFANLYIDAAEGHLRGAGPVRAAWRVAFGACEVREAIVLQHIYLGMNAHLLVDLPVALVSVCPPGALLAARRDFRRINDVVRSELGAFHADLCAISPRLAVLKRVAGGLWASGSGAVLVTAREIAWRRAEELSALPEDARGQRAEELDATAARLARKILEPGPALRLAVRAVRAQESNDVRGIIATLKGSTPALAAA